MEEALTQDKYSKRNSDESHREFQYHCRGANFMLLSHERPGVLVFKLKQAQKNPGQWDAHIYLYSLTSLDHQWIFISSVKDFLVYIQ